MLTTADTDVSTGVGGILMGLKIQEHHSYESSVVAKNGRKQHTDLLSAWQSGIIDVDTLDQSSLSIYSFAG